MFMPNRFSFVRPVPLLTLSPSLAAAASAASTAASGPGTLATGIVWLAELPPSAAAAASTATSSSDTSTAAALPATAGSTAQLLLGTALSVTVVARLEALPRLPTAAATPAWAAASEVDRDRLLRLLLLRLRVLDRLLDRPRSARNLRSGMGQGGRCASGDRRKAERMLCPVTVRSKSCRPHVQNLHPGAHRWRSARFASCCACAWDGRAQDGGVKLRQLRQ